MLKLHLNILDPYVDTFLIVEANRTFSGKDKPQYFFKQEHLFKPFWKKIKYYVVNDWDNVALWNQAFQSPNTTGADHWKREFYIKEHLQYALKSNNVSDDDTVFIGDVDEIIDPTVHFTSEKPVKAKLRVYTYYLNNRSSEAFYGTLIGEYKDIKHQCLNHLRSDTSLYSQGPYLGWHFTSQGGLKELERKLSDSYTEETYFTPTVQQNLAHNHKHSLDFLGRNFTFTIDESEWPEYLKNHRKDYKHLLLTHK